MKKTIAYIALIITCILFGILRSDGAQISYTVAVPLTQTDWTNTVQMHQFPPALGQLYKVQFSSQYTNHRYAGFFSFATNNVTYEITYTANEKVLWPDGTVMMQELHTEWAAGTLGISGGTYTADLTNQGFLNAESCKDFPPAKISPLSWVGNGYLPFKLAGTGVIEVGPMDFNQIFPFFLTQVSMDLTVTYFYTPGLTGTAFPCH